MINTTENQTVAPIEPQPTDGITPEKTPQTFSSQALAVLTWLKETAAYNLFSSDHFTN